MYNNNKKKAHISPVSQHSQSRRRYGRPVSEGRLRPAEHVREADQTVQRCLSTGDHQESQVQEYGPR